MRAGVIALLLLTGEALAQPSEIDKARAKELYTAAENAMAAQDYDTAARDYGAAYELSRDPVLFYKIGTANERAGKCPVAVIYYRRYLATAKPTPAFVDITNARIKACEPDKPAEKPSDPPTTPTTPPTAPVDTPADKPTTPVDAPAEPANPTTEPAKEDPKTAMGSFVGSRDKPGDKVALTSRHRGAWLFVTGSIALVTVGAVLAYSADSAEKDVEDLYTGISGNPPIYDRETKRLYDDLIEEGERYEMLSWVSFGLAGVTAGVAAYLFWRAPNPEKPATITPTVTKDSAGVRAVFSF
ncbi:MAG: hypothetical protein ACKV2T_10675 [Kofleriaceae bacterium]